MFARSQSAAVFSLLVLALVSCGGGESIEELNAKQDKELLARGCAPSFGDGSVAGAVDGLSDGLADDAPVRDNAGEYCPGGEEREVRVVGRAADAKAEVIVKALEKLEVARDGLRMTAFDYIGNPPDARTAYAAARPGFEKLLAEAEATLREVGQPIPDEVVDPAERQASINVALASLTTAREGVARTLEDYRGSLPDAETALASEKPKFQELLELSEEKLRQLDAPIPPE